MTDKDPEIVNPLIGFSMRNDGFISIYVEGETGGKVKILFNDDRLLDSAILGLQEAQKALDLFDELGWVEAAEFVESQIDHEGTKVNDVDLAKFLEGDDS